MINERRDDGVDLRRLALDLLLWLTLATAPASIVGLGPPETFLAAFTRSPVAVSVVTLVALVALVALGAMVYVSHASRTLCALVGLVHASLHVLLWLLIATYSASLLGPCVSMRTASSGIPSASERSPRRGSQCRERRERGVSASEAGHTARAGVEIWFGGVCRAAAQAGAPNLSIPASNAATGAEPRSV